MGKSKALIVALVMLVAGAFLLTLDPAVSTPSVAAVARAVVPVEPPTPVPKLVNGGLALPLSAEAFISVYVPAREVGKGDGAKLEILTEKNATKPWPLASLSKLFTAMAIVDNGGLSDGLTLTAVDVPNAIDVGLFHPGEIFRRQDLMDSMLIESSNNAATALANQVGAETFLAQLNAKSAELGLANTHFFTPHGLDIEGLGYLFFL
jgi:D-alanyl-D-alanine carboxypeptidase